MLLKNPQTDKRLQIFPVSTKIQADSLTIAGHSLAALAAQYGTPLYLYDRASLDFCASAYLDALRVYYPGPASVTYAGKAYLGTAIAQWTQTHGFWVDCTGRAEIEIVRQSGVPRAHILVHGVNKSLEDLQAALAKAGTLVVDNLSELEKIEQMRGAFDSLPDLWLRFTPGVTVQTHHVHTQTGHHESKFGMSRAEFLQAAHFCRERGLPLRGIHFHQGSNFRDPEPLLPAIESGLDLAREIGLAGDWHFCPGGGWGVAYHEDELPQPDVAVYVSGVARHVTEVCQSRGLSLPHLHLEPGRSLVARAGVAVYRVGALKQHGQKTWVLTDGGLTDNPRFALYGARYSCLPVSHPERENIGPVDIAGPYCESGDVVIENLPLPALAVDELLAIPVAGAYHLSMSSNYNGALRPAVLWLEEGRVKEIQRRETIADLTRRDSGIN
ncbi:MAG: diaminopimelate decarboxylase [Anaerolineales bacterium]|jgi:diaminopimelate decarboxylase|nr:diaminopimelate decarboxylase [Anaerolineales bacterium]